MLKRKSKFAHLIRQKMGYVAFNRANNNGCNAKLIRFESWNQIFKCG